MEESTKAIVVEEKKSKRAKERESELGNRIKAWEAQQNTVIDPNLHFVVRLDGHCFHTYSRGFERPCDPLLALPMIETTKDLLKEYHARLGYTESDEITLVFHKNDLIYSGRVQKICSLLAAFASVRFSHHSTVAAEEKERELKAADGATIPTPIQRKLDKMKAHKAIFDARVFSVPDEKGAMEAIWWRHHEDCRRNSVSALAHCHFSPTALHGKSSRQMLDMLKDKGIAFNQLPDSFRFGTFVKKKASFHVGEDLNPKAAGKIVSYMRTEIVAWASHWEGSDEERIKQTFDKYLNQSAVDNYSPTTPTL